MGCIHPFLHYKEITSICGAVDESWQTVDVSDYVPPQAKTVLLYIKNSSSTIVYYHDVRPTGSGYNDMNGDGHCPTIGTLHQKWVMVELNSLYQFDVKRSNVAIQVWIVGWADGAIEWLDTRVDVTPAALTTWTETDLSSYIPASATGAYFYILNGANALKNAGARELGSTNGVIANMAYSQRRTPCGVDANGKVELYKVDANITIYLLGYFTTPVDFPLNWTQKDPAVNGAWVNVDLTGLYATNNMDFTFTYVYAVNSPGSGIAPKDGSGYSVGLCREIGFCAVNPSCIILAHSKLAGDNFYHCGYQETDTNRHQLEITADRTDDYSPSNITYGSTVWGIRWGRKCFLHNGLFWAFYVKQASGISGELYYRTSPDGTTWSNETLIRDTIYRYGGSGQIWFDGTKIHVVTKNTPRLYYRRGTPEPNGTITWDSDWQTAFLQNPVGSTTADHSVSIDSDDYPWVAWCFENTDGGFAALEIYVNGSQNNDGTWTDLAGYPQNITNGTTADNYRMSYLVPLPNRDMYILLFKGNAPPKGRYYTQATDTWETVETISTRNAKNEYTVEALELWSISAIVDAIGHIHLVFMDEDNNIVYCRRDYHLGTWVTAEETVLQTGVPDYATPYISIDHATGTLYVFYIESDEHVYMRRCVNWIWDVGWTDFLDVSDIGVGHDATYGDSGSLTVSRTVINDNLMVLVMGDNPRVIRCKICEVDKTNFTWDGETHPTPWTQCCLLDATEITVVMPLTIGTCEWHQWNDGETSQTRTVMMDNDYAYVGEFNGRTLPAEVETRVVAGKKQPLKWTFDYDWQHVPSEHASSAVTKFNFAETKRVVSHVGRVFGETKRKIVGKLGNVFAETVTVSGDVDALFEETNTTLCDLEQRFEETENVSGLPSEFWVEYVKVKATTESVEREILRRLRTIEDVDDEEDHMSRGDDE